MLPTLERFALTGKIILVTGAGRGLGFEIAKALAGAGGHVILNGRDAERLAAAASRIASEIGGSTETAPFDIADSAALQLAFQSIATKHRRLDVLVNNVGARNRKSLLEFSDTEIRDLVETDLLAGLFLAAEFGPHGITSNAIAPGFFATETNAHLVADPVISASFEKRTPMGRWGRPEEIAGAAVFLASAAASYVNGHVLTVDGGTTIMM